MTTEIPSSAPDTNRLERWVNGVLLYPFIPLVLGACCLIWDTARIVDDAGVEVVLHGAQATAIGIAFIAIGVFVHFHWFWSSHPVLPFIGQVGKAVSLVVISVCLLYVFFSFWIGP